MKHGAIAIVDALGWKGIWGKYPEAHLLDKMRRIEKHASDVMRGVEQRFEVFQGPERMHHEPFTKFRMLSDTIVIAAGIDDYAPLTDPERIRRIQGMFALVTCVAVAHVLGLAARLEPPLNYRGAVNLGEFLVEGNLLLGPAVDEAAEMHEQADAAIVWCLPSAADAITHIEPQGAAMVRDGVNPFSSVFRYPVPLKCHPTPVDALAVSHFGLATEHSHAADTVNGIKRAFGTDPKHEGKRKATEAFLVAAEKHWRESRSGWSSRSSAT